MGNNEQKREVMQIAVAPTLRALSILSGLSLGLELASLS